MKKAILDTSFILTSIRQKIDFFEEIEYLGLKVIIPEEVIKEIRRIAESGKKLHFRENASLALKILDKKNFESISLEDENVDRGLTNLAKKDKNFIIATLDKELKYRIKRPIILIRGKKKIEII